MKKRNGVCFSLFLLTVIILGINTESFSQTNSFAISRTVVDYMPWAANNISSQLTGYTDYTLNLPSYRENRNDTDVLIRPERISVERYSAHGAYDRSYIAVYPLTYRGNMPWAEYDHSQSCSLVRNTDPKNQYLEKSSTNMDYNMVYVVKNITNTSKRVYIAFDHIMDSNYYETNHSLKPSYYNLEITSSGENHDVTYFALAYDMNDDPNDIFQNQFPSNIPSATFNYRDSTGVLLSPGEEIEVCVNLTSSFSITDPQTDNINLNVWAHSYIAFDDAPISESVSLKDLNENIVTATYYQGDGSLKDLPEVAVQLGFTADDGTSGANENANINIQEFFKQPNSAGGNNSNKNKLHSIYWKITTNNTPGSYDIRFDLSDIRNSINDFNELSILKRADSTQAWVDVTTLGATITRNEPYITVHGLNGFSEFVPAESGNSTLPVVMSRFNAHLNDDLQSIINWVTQSENNLEGYNILKSDKSHLEDARRINRLLIVANNSSTQTDYSFLDNDTWEGDNYYWIEAIDYSGMTTHFGPIKIIKNDNEDNPTPSYNTKYYVANYPNPFNPNTIFEFVIPGTGFVDTTIKIYNLKGQLVKTLKSKNVETNKVYSQVWNGADENNRQLNSGIYYYKLIINGKVYKVNKCLLLK